MIITVALIILTIAFVALSPNTLIIKVAFRNMKYVIESVNTIPNIIFEKELRI